MALDDIANTIAAYFKQPRNAFIVNGVDLIVTGLNNAKRKAERFHDFRYSGQRCTLTFTGGAGSGMSQADISGILDEVNDPVILKRIQYLAIPIKGPSNTTDYLPIEFLTDETWQARRAMNAGRGPYQPNNSAVQYGITQDAPFAVQYGTTIFIYGLGTNSPSFISSLNTITFLAPYVSATTVTVSSAGTSGYDGVYTNYGQLNGATLFICESLQTAIWWLPFLVSTNPSSWQITPITQLGNVSPTPGYFLAPDPTLLVNGFIPSPAGTYTAIDGGTTGSPVAVSAVTQNTDDFFTTYGPEYLQWAGILEVNKYWLQFVAPRQEGNIPEDSLKQLADEALQSLIAWDDGIYTGTSTPSVPPPAQPASTIPTLMASK